MAIEKVGNRHGDLSRASSTNSVVKSRCFHLYDHSKTSRLPMSLSLTSYKRTIPSILKQQKKQGMGFTNTRPLKQRKVNIMDDSQSSSSSSSSSSSLISASSSLMPSCFSSSSEDTIKTGMPSNILIDNDQSSPQPHSSFSPPPFSNNNNSSQSQQGNNNVTFHSKVLVMRIPSRKQYPESMKRSLWCSMSEISRSAQRNSIEFQSEGWDWRSAVEENCMYYHPKSGQYIHPVHVKRSSSSSSTSTSSTSNVENNTKQEAEAAPAPVAVLKNVETTPKESMEARPTHE